MNRREQERPFEMHWIGVKAYRLYLESGRSLAPEMLRELEDDLAIVDAAELADAVTGVTVVAQLARKENKPAADEALINVVKSTRSRFDSLRRASRREKEKPAAKAERFLNGAEARPRETITYGPADEASLERVKKLALQAAMRSR